ncbi:hypothetical protein [Nostoc sp.]|uniref:hypothetical protein n=1 Tax=Nostoc sp. TaxID=1180 RepID=UPI003FA60687
MAKVVTVEFRHMYSDRPPQQKESNYLFPVYAQTALAVAISAKKLSNEILSAFLLS